ncbi:MAG: UDP-N-acetylglucosamine 2-epimerase (non-hydrolyzing) [Parachlamydiales bacterium]|nr:UDP-N-acetylglucosamine 2-epimerase (non-hydrolyzing) [Parachlamydiales bacterium]
MKIISIVGARPQFIKAAAVARAIPEGHFLIHTGQHYDANMSDIFFEEMEIPKPKYNLGIGGCPQAAMTGRIMEALEEILVQEKPDTVIVYGDTNSTMAGALVASKLHTPIAHVEAGLRSFNRKMPEEINRVVTDHVSNLLFAPTQAAIDNLKNEGITKGVHLVGDVMYDTTLFYKKKMRPPKVKLPKEFYLCTIHRQENTDDIEKLKSIFAALRELPDQIILPLHPRTRKMLQNIDTQGLTLIEPVGYFEMLYLLENCKAVLTDSGGLQKESYFFGKPLLILREETEWIELIQCKVAHIVRNDPIDIQSKFKQIQALGRFPANLYGQGNASNLIAKYICG